MTNLKTITGGMAWTATAALLLLATLEPVSVEQNSARVSATAFAEAEAVDAAL